METTVGYCLAGVDPKAPVRDAIRGRFGARVEAVCSRSPKELLTSVAKGERAAGVLTWETTEHGMVVESCDAMLRTPNLHVADEITARQARFIVIRRIPAKVPDGFRARSIIAAEVPEKSGHLSALVDLIESRGANRLKIDSRPSEVPWSYWTILDFEHVVTALGMARLSAGLRVITRSHRMLGTYALEQREAQHRTWLRRGIANRGAGWGRLAGSA